MINLKSWKTFIFFAKAYPTRGIFMVSALVVAGLLEGIGIMALLPLVAILTEQSALQSGVVSDIIQNIFHFLGLEVSIGPILLFIVTIIILKSLITMLAMTQVAYSSSHVCTDLRLAYLRSVLKSSWKHFTGLQSGSSANALGTEAQRAAYSFMHGCYALSWSIQVLVYTTIAFLISWKLTLSAVAAGFVMVFLLSSLVRTGRKAGNDQTKVLDSVLARITDTLYGAKPLKAMGKTDNLLSIMEQDAVKLRSVQRRMDISVHAIRVLSEPIMVIFMSIGIYGILSYGSLPVAELLFLALLFLRMVMKISTVQSAYLSMATNESALWSLRAKIDAAATAVDYNEGKIKPTLKKGIKFKNISFSYDDEPILNDISLELPSRGFYVIFGPSGAGKTTFLDLTTGLHQPVSGEIEIDNHPLQSIDMNEWRHKIGYVPQDVLLFHDTVANNVTLNSPDITKNQIVEALKTADALGFVEKMEHGLDTIVGERGTKLSGGQRQRIAIARAIIDHPSLLILDEATSALDKETEQELLKTVKSLSKDILVLAISHDPASLTMADKVFRLENKKLEEVTPEKLARMAG